jgi:hypothetical protein
VDHSSYPAITHRETQTVLGAKGLSKGITKTTETCREQRFIHWRLSILAPFSLWERFKEYHPRRANGNSHALVNLTFGTFGNLSSFHCLSFTKKGFAATLDSINEKFWKQKSHSIVPNQRTRRAIYSPSLPPVIRIIITYGTPEPRLISIPILTGLLSRTIFSHPMSPSNNLLSHPATVELSLQHASREYCRMTHLFLDSYNIRVRLGFRSDSERRD